MPDRSVTTRFEARVDGYLAGVAKMQAANDKLSKSAVSAGTQHKASWDKVSKAALVGGGIIGAAVVGAIKANADFEKSMSGVAAVADANQSQLKALATAARDAGKATVFSAMDAAKAEAELAKAGVSVKDILGGGLKGSLDLAAAGQIDLAKSAEISAQAMNIFKLRGSDVGHIADVLTAGANKSAAGVDDLGMALSQGGLVARQTGLSLEDTVGTLSLFADNALKGSDAGTSLRTMLGRLTPQSQEAADKMAELGLHFYDSQGRFVGVEKAAGQLQQRLGGLSTEERNAAVQTIFGQDAQRGANILIDQGAAGLRKYIAAVNDQGAAQRMAARQTDNLVGDVERLKGAISDTFIGAGEGANSPLRGLIQDVSNLVALFGKLSPEQQSAIVKTAALASGFLVLAGGTVKVVTTVTDLKRSFETATGSMGKFGTGLERSASIATRTATAIVAAGAAAGALDRVFGADNKGIGIQGLAKDLATSSDAVDAFSARVEKYANQSSNWWNYNDVRSYGDVLKTTFDPSVGAQLDNVFGSIMSFFGGDNLSDIAIGKDRLSELDQALASLVSSGNADVAAQKFSQFAAEAKRSGVGLEDFKAKLPGYQEALDSIALSTQTVSYATMPLPPVVKAAATAAQDAATATSKWSDTLNNLSSPVLNAREAANKWQESIWAANKSLKDNGATLNAHTAKGIANRRALDAMAQSALGQIDALAANNASQKTLQSTLKVSRDRLIATYLQFDNNRARAKAYADQVLKTPDVVNTKVNADTAQAKANIDGTQAALTRINGRTATVYIYTEERIRTVRESGNLGVANSMDTANRYATGSAYRRAAGGPVYGPGTSTSDSIDARLSNGEHVLTASDVQKAGGQEAIYRMRAGIQAGILKFRDGGAVGKAGFADGGAVDFSSILSILGDITDWSEVTSARGNRTRKAQAYASARNALASLVAQQRKAARDLSAARKAGDHNRINDILDRQRVLLGKVAAAEQKVAAARTASAAAAKNTAKVEAEYRADKRPIIDRTIAATASVNRSSLAFLNNIDKLTKMGFKTLAMDLLAMGGTESPQAEAIAAQAVKSATKAKQLQAEFLTSSSLSAREAQMKGALAGGSPTLADMAMPAAPRVTVQMAPTQAVAAGPVYVQNPFTGEYLLAKVDGVAGQRVATAASRARNGY